MNAKGVEDGMSDEVQKDNPRQSILAGVKRGIHVEPATDEEISAYLGSLNGCGDEMYYCGVADLMQKLVARIVAVAQPTVPVEERTAVESPEDAYFHGFNVGLRTAHNYIVDREDREDQSIQSIAEAIIDLEPRAYAPPVDTPIPEERTAEIEQLMGRLRIAAQKAVETEFLVDISAFNSEACPENILLLLDHIEGKPK